jgi:hypothetical protein
VERDVDQISGKRPLDTNERREVRVIISERGHRQWLKARLKIWAGYATAVIAAAGAAREIQQGGSVSKAIIGLLSSVGGS